MPTYTQTIEIAASLAQVDRCLTDPTLMHRWLNPLLRCEAVGSWSDQVGSQFRFLIGIPLWQPVLTCEISSRGIETEQRWIEWSFAGFFVGSDRWQMQSMTSIATSIAKDERAKDSSSPPEITKQITKLINSFDFEIPNPLVSWGFNVMAAGLTQSDMQAQLQRLQQVAEALSP